MATYDPYRKQENEIAKLRAEVEALKVERAAFIDAALRGEGE